jgi:hypothetical protein
MAIMGIRLPIRKADANNQVSSSAAVRGAVIQRLDALSNNLPEIQHRVCRRHYGISVLEPFDMNRHPDEDMVVDPNTDKVFARGVEFLFIVM